MWINYNANPINKRVGDCTVRAISKALGQSWEKTYIDIFLRGFMMFDMPSANAVWGAYLKSRGFIRNAVTDNGSDYYTVSDFCRDNPKGTYILALAGHVVAVIDGDHYDTWDSGEEIPVYYWERRNEDA